MRLFRQGVFVLVLIFTAYSGVSQEYQTDKLRYVFRILVLSDVLENYIFTTDSIELYCLLHDTNVSQFNYEKITTDRKFSDSNYELYFLMNDFVVSPDCINHPKKDNIGSIHFMLNYGSLINYIVAVKYKRIVTKEEIRILPKKIFKIHGFHTSEFREVMEDVLDTKSKRKIRRYLKKNPIKGDNYNLINEL